jgi:hypothetical protein
MKTAKNWEHVISYDYRTYIMKNTATGATKEICLFDVKTPTIEEIKGSLKCGV